jgi:catechol 2,3-dioxygenase-like lactoylglutathione lyase family enzyme
MPAFRLTAAVLETPDPQGLARFYQRLLGWPLRDDTPQWATLRPADGSTGLSFQLDPDHLPPVWPPEPDAPRMQLHLDLEVDDLDAGEAAVVALGARKHEVQPGTTFRVFLDPAGHPFCLVTA